MSAQEFTSAAMSLPISVLVTLAQALWQSIDVGLLDPGEREAVREAVRRDNEITSGAVIYRTHDDVMKEATRRLTP